MARETENILEDLIARIARVRCWLVALGALKTAAVGLACLCLYVGLYAWIDHHAHFGHTGRVCALLVLLALLTLLGYVLIRALKHNMTYTCAANYVENRRSFDQQLVAAVEYFERKEDYPYSRTLADQLVLQVDESAREFRFDSVIKKWQGYVLAGLIALSLCVVGWFVQQNLSYFAAYLSRLLRPLAKIEPVPATVLTSATDDIVAARNDSVTLSAAIQGRTPESASLVLTRGDPNDANGLVERIEVRPIMDAQGNATLTTTRSFDTTGQVSYRFEADGVSSTAHTVTVCEPPAIKSVTATVSLPQGQNTQQVKDGILEVPPESVVEMQVQSTTPLREANVATPGGQPAVKGPGGTDTFTVRFSADAASSMDFKLTSSDGIANREPQQLRIVLKGDEPPQFKLLCPEGDCIATDVASIPITFEVTDDFGLDSAQLYCELPNRGATLLDSKPVKGVKSATLTHTLELEQYDLRVGDSILFYARATDISTGHKARDANSCSEVYFVEIRPYRQYWHPEAAGKPSSIPGPVPEGLITLLEYTRAALKKTWTLANASSPSSESMDALRRDVEYCAQLLAKTRDDPENGFSDSDKAALNRIEEQYVAAGDNLNRHNPAAALPVMRDAYRLLRQFIDELHLKWTPPQSGQGVPENKPERIKLQEEPQGSAAQQQRLENQLEQLQRKIESLARRQKSLSSDLDKAMEQEQAASSGGQPSSASSSNAGKNGQPSSSKTQGSQQPSAKDTQSAGQDASQQARDDKQDAATSGNTAGDTGSPEAGEDSDKQASTKGQTDGNPSASKEAKSRATDKSSTQQGSSSGSQGAPKDNQAKADSTQAQGSSASTATPSQAADRSMAQQGSSPISPGTPQDGQAKSTRAGSQGDRKSDAPQSSSPTSPGSSQNGKTGEARSTGSQGEGKAPTPTDARLRMLEARQKALREQASQVQDELAQLAANEVTAPGRARDEAQKHVAQAIEKMRQSEDKLTEARYEPAARDKAGLSEPASSARRELTEAGRAIRQGLAGDNQKSSAEQAREMAEQLAEDAETLDESLSPADRRQMLERLEAARRLLQNSPDPQWSTVSSGGSASGTLVYTQGGAQTAAETARMLARQFWSMAIEAKQRELRPFAEQPSDAEFFQAENDFFEKAAQFREPQTEK